MSALLCLAVRAGQVSTIDQLYLLSGTPTNYGDEAFPVSLYRIDGQKLKTVRQIVPKNVGLYAVSVASNALFILYPNETPTAASIIHFDQPDLSDDVTFNPKGLVVLQSFLTVAQPPGEGTEELIPLVTEPPKPPDPLLGTVLSISSDLNAKQRVKTEAWVDYQAIYREGDPGGAFDKPSFVAASATDRIVVSLFGKSTAIGPLPPALVGAQHLSIVVASSKYLGVAVIPARIQDVLQLKSREVFVLDRERHKWITVPIEGSSIFCRLFDDWMACRGEEQSTFQVIENLKSQRKIQMETGQTDNEILAIKGDKAFYRINDAIYEGILAGNSLRSSSLLVKDDSVHEIHWIFWSK